METKQIDWGVCSFLLIYHILLVVALPLYFIFIGLPSLWTILITLFLWIATGMSITGGYHRLYAHRSFQSGKLAEFFFLFFGTMAAQGSVLQWTHNHRIHHRFVDGEHDPHSIKKGFWHAHMTWLFSKRPPLDEKVVSDLASRKILQFQHNHYALLVWVTNFMAFFGMIAITKDFWGGVVFGYLLRTFLLHHFTWFINSLAHFWGSQSYSREFSAVDNYVIALLTFGEGYHNYHHTFSSDYRNGIAWYHFDPTKWLIWTLSKLGLAGKLVQFNNYSIKHRLMQEDKELILQKIKHLVYVNKKVVEEKVHTFSTRLSQRIATLKEKKNAFVQAKKQKLAKHKLIRLKQAFKQEKRDFKKDWRGWSRLVKSAMRLEPM